MNNLIGCDIIMNKLNVIFNLIIIVIGLLLELFLQTQKISEPTTEMEPVTFRALVSRSNRRATRTQMEERRLR